MRKGFSFTFLVLGLLAAASVRADTVSDLQAKIDAHTTQIAALEKEIAGYQKSLSSTTAQADSLKGELQTIDLQGKKLAADAAVTQNQIDKANLTIEQLGLDIGKKDASIEDYEASLGESLRELGQIQQVSLPETLLSSTQFQDFAAQEERLGALEARINTEIADLRSTKVALNTQKTATEAQKRTLMALSTKLADQKKIIDQNRAAKNTLLKQTQNTEANYRQLLADRQAQKAAFEAELFNFESQLKIAIDKSRLPQAGSRPLSWPLAPPIVITQYFGKTIDAARLYVSGTHGGVDLRASVGTPIIAAAGGTVTATEDTVTRAGCQYGYWVLLEHPNGLSTIYGHLSLVKVAPGEKVRTGDLLGYSGQTGYAEGPHLHFGVYATQGLRLVANAATLAPNPSKSICQGIRTVAADPKAYLDPMLYLPTL